MSQPPPLKRLHPDSTLERGVYRFSLEYWRRQSTETIVDSLQPRSSDPTYQEFLKVRADGTVLQGNTRIKALEERGYNVNSLPRYAVD